MVTPLARSSRSPKQRLPFRGCERGSRFVKQKNAGLALKRANDFHHLLIRYGKHPGHGLRRNSHAESGAQFLEPAMHDALGKKTETRTSLSEEHVRAGRKTSGRWLVPDRWRRHPRREKRARSRSAASGRKPRFPRASARCDPPAFPEGSICPPRFRQQGRVRVPAVTSSVTSLTATVSPNCFLTISESGPPERRSAVERRSPASIRLRREFIDVRLVDNNRSIGRTAVIRDVVRDLLALMCKRQVAYRNDG